MNILQINSSARAAGHSTALANQVTARLQAANPGAALVLRDLTSNPHPPLDEATLGALFTPAESRTAEQNARIALDTALIDEVKAADAIVIGTPMYNFTVSSQLKNWIDAIAKAGVTFKYTETGPVGLLTGKRAYVALSRGGIYRDTPNDTMVPYLKMLLGFIGITDVTFFFAEGLAMGPDAEKAGLDSAQAQIAELLQA